MNKLLIFYILLNCCCLSPYKHIAKPADNDSCKNELTYVKQEYTAIDSILKTNGIYLNRADSVFSKYRNRILEYFSKNSNIFKLHDTVFFGINYQKQNQIGCEYIFNIDTTVRDKTIKEFNSYAFPERTSFDSTLIYCIGISGDAIKTTNGIIFDNIEYDLGTATTKGRSRASIMRSIMGILPNMRYAYNAFLRDKTGLKGKITIKFTIGQNGSVIYAKVVNSTLNYCPMEKKELSIIAKTNFEEINVGKGLTTVIYPFVFSQ
jgi:hypothetical protein